MDEAGHVFISYAREDFSRVEPVIRMLGEQGWVLWWDQKNLPLGQRNDRVIEQALDQSSCVVVFWSADSVRSDWVRDEADEGKEAGKLIPVLLDAIKPPLGFRGRNFIDLSSNDPEASARLVAAIRAFAPAKRPRAQRAGQDRRTDDQSPVVSAQTVNPGPSKGAPLDPLIAELDRRSTSPQRRLDIGDLLARNGDTRRGVCLDGDAIPDIAWCEVPSGAFRYGDTGDQIELPTYSLSRYPVTNAQYEAFIEAGGYEQRDKWWQGLNQMIPESGGWSQSNRPRESVSWYEAVAYCRWLSAQLGYEVRLPTEQEWEKGARGKHGRRYPWGDEYQVGIANLDETKQEDGPNYLEQTTAVGIYPQGASPYGIEDMSGNVREWCADKYETPHDTGPSGDEPRVLRGGSWFVYPCLACAWYRFWYLPNLRNRGWGFRLCCSSPIPH
ncbi:MAG: SUMF1/EgtB/PvdO family nonheme iron enzyme [Pseudomonadota bacterium]